MKQVESMLSADLRLDSASVIHFDRRSDHRD